MIMIENSKQAKTTNHIFKENIYLNEEEYIKSYLRCICAFKGISKNLAPILYAFSKYIEEYKGEHSEKIIHISGNVIEEVCGMTGLKAARINKALRDIVMAEIFIRVPHKRGIYRVSPFILKRDEWHHLEELKVKINFTKGCFEICMGKNEFININ